MIIKKILADGPTDEKDLNKYYEKREKAVKWCKENEESEQYDTVVNPTPVYTHTVNTNNSIENRFIAIGLVLYEPKKQKYRGSGK